VVAGIAGEVAVATFSTKLSGRCGHVTPQEL